MNEWMNERMTNQSMKWNATDSQKVKDAAISIDCRTSECVLYTSYSGSYLFCGRMIRWVKGRRLDVATIQTAEKIIRFVHVRVQHMTCTSTSSYNCTGSTNSWLAG